jgi:hypothetical protein
MVAKQGVSMSGLFTLDEYKTRAAILLKNLRSDDSIKAEVAALRFQILPYLADSSPQAILEKRETIKLKHALTVLALENQFDTWADLKRNVEYNDKRIAFRNRNFTSLCPRRCWGVMSNWEVRYEDALDTLQQRGGYLLPYKQQFFVCQEAYIEKLGLDPDDIDWELIGWNWVKPADSEAWERLNEKLEAVEAKQRQGF